MPPNQKGAARPQNKYQNLFACVLSAQAQLKAFKLTAREKGVY
jgi:hypothetical protein